MKLVLKDDKENCRCIIKKIISDKFWDLFKFSLLSNCNQNKKVKSNQIPVSKTTFRCFFLKYILTRSNNLVHDIINNYFL